MRELNRSVLVPKPRQPFLDWIHALDPDDRKIGLAELREDCVALLVPEMEEPAEMDAFLEEHHGALFEYLLAGWIDEPDSWPETRDLATLREWFDLEFSTLVFDVCDWPLEYVEEPEVDDDDADPVADESKN